MEIKVSLLDVFTMWVCGLILDDGFFRRLENMFALLSLLVFVDRVRFVHVVRLCASCP
jgi:hypothetical protein